MMRAVHRRVTGYLWGRLPEPRIIHALMLWAWGILAGIGVLAVASPPQSVSAEIGPLLAAIWGSMLALGGVLGLLGILSRWWWVERAGIYAALTGTLIYLTTVLHLHVAEDGNRLVQAGFILLTLLFLATRLVRIWGLQTDPTRR